MDTARRVEIPRVVHIGTDEVYGSVEVGSSKESDPLLQAAIKTLQSPDTTFRFGADDAMPTVVENAFWKGIVDWTNGMPQAQAEAEIQAAWANVSN